MNSEHKNQQLTSITSVKEEFDLVLWVVLQCVIVVLPDHTISNCVAHAEFCKTLYTRFVKQLR